MKFNYLDSINKRYGSTDKREKGRRGLGRNRRDYNHRWSCAAFDSINSYLISIQI
jgi:hypothetical protein